jgi:hypothetical protein
MKGGVSMADFQTIVGKALSDTKFCQELVANPEKTLRGQGIEPTREMIDALKGLDANAVQKLAAAFGKEQAAF